MSVYAHYPSLKGRHVFITGGATGIGASLVHRVLAQFGHRGEQLPEVGGDLGQDVADLLATDPHRFAFLISSIWSPVPARVPLFLSA